MSRLGHHRRSRTARPGDERQRGAVVVEFALIALLLITMLAGAFDYGMAWRVGLAANEAARAGARVGSGQGKTITADFSLLSSMRSALQSSGELENVRRVIIFNSTTTSGTVPATCVTGSGSGQQCNILTGTQFRNLSATSAGALTASGCISNSAAKGYCPTTREDVQLHAHYLGVWVQVEYDYVFPLLGDSVTVERTAVMRIEPKESTP